MQPVQGRADFFAAHLEQDRQNYSVHTPVQQELMGFKGDFVNYNAKHCSADSKRINEIWQILKLHSQKLVIVGLYCSCSVILRRKPIGHYINSLCHTSFHSLYSHILILVKHICHIYAYLQKNLRNFKICIIHTLVKFFVWFFFLVLVPFNP